jgi:RNA polymerase sigma factor (sigma-70 family)
VNRLKLQTLFRAVLADPEGVSDADLLTRYRQHGDEAAFAAMVNRYGRLVWAVCRHQTRSDADAEDAFQATFFVLARNAGTVRNSVALGSWLHGVAYKVCAKARKAAQARVGREQSVSRGESATAVPDSAWDRALAAVHDELARLPETLRTPFVLCCLEGKGTTAAAEQLGWKLGTFSGRLSKAKDLLMARLEARGLTAGAVAAVAITGGAAYAPAAVADRVVAFASVGIVVPKSILTLSQGALEMGLTKTKLLAAGLIVACGLGTTVGTNWIARADDPKPKPAVKSDQPGKINDLGDLLSKIRDDQDPKVDQFLFDMVNQPSKTELFVAAPSKWEYEFIGVVEADIAAFRKFLGEREARGWEFNGHVTVTSNGKPSAAWMFRRPAKVKQTDTVVQNAKTAQREQDRMLAMAQRDAKEDRIRQLEAELARLKGQTTGPLSGIKIEKTFTLDDLPLGTSEMWDILHRLSVKKVTVHSPSN